MVVLFFQYHLLKKNTTLWCACVVFCNVYSGIFFAEIHFYMLHIVKMKNIYEIVEMGKIYTRNLQFY